MLDESSQPQVCIIVVNWNGQHHLEECLGSLRELHYDNYVILLVDNGSTDESVEYVRRSFPECEIIHNATNLGCGGGRNVGLKWARARDFDYVGFLDNDMRVDASYLGHLVTYLEENPAVGAAAARVNYYDAPDRVRSMGGSVSLYLWRTTLNGQGMREEDVASLEALKVDLVNGGACLARTSAIREVGSFDESFWRGQDIDWSLRFREKGFGLVCVPQAVMWHKGAGLTGSHGFGWWSLRNSWVYFRRYGSCRHWVTAPLALSLQVAKLVLRPMWERYMNWRMGARVLGPGQVRGGAQTAQTQTNKQR